MAENEDDRVTGDPIPPADGGLVLDAFSFSRDAPSRIAGLGGSGLDLNPTYALHTPYVRVARGPARFTIRVEGLTASFGKLVLQVNMLPAAGDAHARPASSQRVDLAELAAAGGEASVGFEGFRGMTYALYGFVPGETDARATGLVAILDRPFDGRDEDDTIPEADAAPSAPPVPVMAATRLITPEHGRLAYPVSQMCSAAQFDEPVYGEWLGRLHLPLQRQGAQWEQIYVLQALRSYGAIVPDARGLGFAADGGAVPAMLAALGASVTMAGPAIADGPDAPSTPDAGGPDRLRRPELCEDARFDAAVTVRPIDMAAIPQDLAGYDFLWSARADEQLGSVAAGMAFIRQSLACLRPGGIGVHTLLIDTAPDVEIVTSPDASRCTRRDIERLALVLISHGHEVAQVRFGAAPARTRRGGPPAAPTTSFGLIVRKTEGL